MRFIVAGSFFILYLTFLSPGVTGVIPCGLDWTSMSIGSVARDSAVYIHKDKTLAARLLLTDTNTYILGQYNVVNQTVTFPPFDQNPGDDFEEEGEQCDLGGGGTTPPSWFEVLGNSAACTLSWIERSPHNAFPPPHVVRLNKTDVTSAIVGRAVIEGQFHPGVVRSNSTGHFLEVVLPVTSSSSSESQMIWTPDFQVLTATSEGLHLTMEDIVFLNEPPPPTVGILGVDRLVNRAEATVFEKVNHSKRLVESHTFPVSDSHRTISPSATSSTKNVLFPAILGKSTSVTMETKFDESIEEVKTVTKETTVTVESEVAVPPLSTVAFCSVVLFREDLSLNYEATGVYEAPGLSGPEILEILKKEGRPGEMDMGGRVTVPLTGVFKGSLAMNSQTVAIESEGGASCSEFYRRRGFKVADKSFMN